MRLFSTIACVSSSVVALWSRGADGNLLANPSFEEETTDPILQGQYGQNRELPGWNCESGAVAPILLSEYDGISAAEGSNWIEPIHNGISQDIPTEKGATYILTFYMHAGSGDCTASEDKAIFVEWDGAVVGNTRAPFHKWDKKKITLTGTGAVVRLVLRKSSNADNSIDEYGPFVDMVELVEQPRSSPRCTVPKLSGSWDEITKYPLIVTEAQGNIMANEFIIVSGFTDYYENCTNTAHAIDLYNTEGGWRELAPLPVTEGITHAATVAIGDKFYMCGGYLGGHPGPAINTCLVYDYSGDEWSFLQSLPEERAGGGLIYSSVTDTLLFSGGATRPNPRDPFAIDHRSTWMYSFADPDAGWVSRKDLPYLSNHMSSVSAIDETGMERHYFLAGQRGENEFTGNNAQNYEWDMAQEDWIRRKNMPQTRGHASASITKVDCGFVLSGGSSNGVGGISNVEYYEIQSDTWTTIGYLPQGLNTPVCDIHYEREEYICITGLNDRYFSWKTKIDIVGESESKGSSGRR